MSKVLSALGSHSQDSGAMELPSDIIQAWGARKEKLAAEATNVQNRNQKLAVGQRPTARLRYVWSAAIKFCERVLPDYLVATRYLVVPAHAALHRARTILIASPCRRQPGQAWGKGVKTL